jgi:ParB family chromosome partitioning protein
MGLEALLPDVSADDEVREIDIERIVANPYQPRRVFNEEALAELTTSIKEHGVIQPIIVRGKGDGFQVVAGERRLRASKAAGLARIPAVIRDYSETQMMEIALVENIQRSDLNPIEEAAAMQRLMNEFGLTQEKMAERVGRSRPYVSNMLRILSLPDDVKDYVSRGTLTMGHARALLALGDVEAIRRAAQRIVNEKLSVRDAEALATPEPTATKGKTKSRRKKAGATGAEAPDLRDAADELMKVFGTQVRIVGDATRGRVEIEYFSEDDLERVLEIAAIARAAEETRRQTAASDKFHI